MVKMSKALIEKSILKGRPWYFFQKEQRTTPISSTIPLLYTALCLHVLIAL